jgi:hypothetical protein
MARNLIGVCCYFSLSRDLNSEVSKDKLAYFRKVDRGKWGQGRWEKEREREREREREILSL